MTGNRRVGWLGAEGRTSPKRPGAGAVAAVVLALAAGPGDAQETRPDPARERHFTPPADGERPPPSQPAGGLGMERDVFAYLLGDRRDPFLPLLAPPSGGPRFHELRLLGIIHHQEARYSLVLLATGSGGGVGGGEGSGGGTGEFGSQSYRLRPGEIVGDTRILEIREDGVGVEVNAPAGKMLRVLRLPRPARRSRS